MEKTPLRFVAAAAALGLFALSGCTGQAFCEKRRECAADPPGADFVRICVINYDGQLSALGANKEDECHALADAKLRYDACVAQLDCRDFNEPDHNGECDDEREGFFDALEDAEGGIECSTAD